MMKRLTFNEFLSELRVKVGTIMIAILLIGGLAATMALASEEHAADECEAIQEAWLFCDDFDEDRLSSYYHHSHPALLKRTAGTGMEDSTSLDGIFSGNNGHGNIRLAFGKTPDALVYKPVGDPDEVVREFSWRFYVKNDEAWSVGEDGMFANLYAYGPNNQVLMKVTANLAYGAIYSYVQTANLDGNGNPNGLNSQIYVGTGKKILEIGNHDWNLVEFQIKLNDPGQSNGKYQVYINENLVSDLSNMNWIGSYQDYGFNVVEFEQSLDASGVPQQHRYIDNLVLSTEPVGPIETEDEPTDPEPPGSLHFEDDFETGDLSNTNSFFEWSDQVYTGVSSDIARSGSQSLKFTYNGGPEGTYSWSEQRFDLLSDTEEIWISWYQYYPDGTEGLGPEWNHRAVDGWPNNNKLLLIGNKNWEPGGHGSFNQYGFETEPLTGGNSKVDIKWVPDGNSFGVYGKPSINGGILQDDTTRGRWVEYIAHFEVSSGWQVADGVAELWVDGTKVHNHHDLNAWLWTGGPNDGEFNIFNHGYLMGWANSGFHETSYTYIDDFVISVTPPDSLEYEEEEPPVNPITVPVNECTSNPNGQWIFCDDFEADKTNQYYDYFSRWGRFLREPVKGISNSIGITSYFGYYGADPETAPHGTWLRKAFGKTPDNTYYKPSGNTAEPVRDLYSRFFMKSNSAEAETALASTGPLMQVLGYGPGNVPFMNVEVGYPDQSGKLQSILYTGEFDGNGEPTGLVLHTELESTTPVMHRSEAGTWHEIEVHVKLNTPGQSNGVYELWINGVLESSLYNINWTGAYTDYGINAFEIYNTNNQPGVAGNDSEFRVFDNLILSHSRIGQTEEEQEATASLTIDSVSKLVNQEFEVTVGVQDTTPFTAAEVMVSYDPQQLEFDTETEGGIVVLADTAIESLLPNFTIANAIKVSEGKIMFLLLTAGEANAASGDLPLFKLHGKVRANAALGSTAITLSNFKISMDGSGPTLDTSTASVEMEISQADKSDLIAALSSAQQIYDSAVVGSQPGQYLASVKTALNNAIQAASAVRNNMAATPLEISNSVAALQAAVTTFTSSVNPSPSANLTALQSAIASAESKHEQAAEGTKLGKYTAGSKATLFTAIQSAKLVRDNNSATQAQVDQAVTALNQAKAAFAAAIITLTPGATSISIHDLSIISKYFGATSSDANWSEIAIADVFGEAEITIEDLAAVAQMILANWFAE
ncbi:cohesin domain-containing protein [Paenibacillus sp. strain BS8-2]